MLAGKPVHLRSVVGHARNSFRGTAAFGRERHPYEEHDFGSFEADGATIFFKIDYYDSTLTVHSPDPSEPAVTKRVITIMLAEEY
jgi:hypothetical protein